MTKTLKRAILLIFAITALTACTTTSYRVGNETYRTRDDAMAVALRKFAEAESVISASPKPLVDRKLLIATATASAIARTMEASKAAFASKESANFFAEVNSASIKSISSSLKKANIYRETEVVELDTTTPDLQPSPSQDVFMFYLGSDGGRPIISFSSAKGGRQVVAVDIGKASISDQRKSIVDDVRSKALQ